jgi:hypothetical protein
VRRKETSGSFRSLLLPFFISPFLLSRGLFDIAECSDVRTLRRHGNLPHNDTSRGVRDMAK